MIACRVFLSGKWALVTGSAGGIDAGMALSRAHADALVVVSDINSEGVRAAPLVSNQPIAAAPLRNSFVR
jgi:NAD(P)-dependent dehydrogenase (short-subunit alcohol dehydrogenase family)